MEIRSYLTGPLGVNCYVVIDEETKKAFMVDPGGYKKDVEDYIKNSGADLQYIILTHGHGDHIGGVLDFMKIFPNAKLLALKEEEDMLKNSYANFSVETYGQPLQLNADILVSDNDTLAVGNMNLKFIATPGHTKGGMCIYVGNVLFSGDTLFAQSIGRTDFPGGSFEEIMDSIKNKLFLLPDETKVFPGHMGTTSIGFEKGNNPFV